jgi:hypothetical protein
VTRSSRAERCATRNGPEFTVYRALLFRGKLKLELRQ